MNGMLLSGKSAVIYGAGGGVGRFVAKAFAREGATVFLAGRTTASLEAVSQEISKARGAAEVDMVDALDQKQIDEHLRKVVAKAGKLDISFNLISTTVGVGRTLTSLSEEQFMRCAFTLVKSNFLTATAAARQMEKQGSGVILGLTAVTARKPRANQGGFAIAGAAIETLCRQLALEAGPKGVRVVCLRTGGTPDNPIVQEAFAELARLQGITKEEFERKEAVELALKRLPLLAEVANTAVLMASDYASAITATAINASNGDIVD
jgi:3-oxoacyl-[acyl-carrier protein] reductase